MRGQVNMVNKQNFVAQFIQLVKRWLCVCGQVLSWIRIGPFLLTSACCRHCSFWCKFGFGKCFGASSQSSHWAGWCCLSYKIHFSLHATVQSRNGSLLLCRIREDDSSEGRFFWFAVSSQGTCLPSRFTFPICFKCQRTQLSGWCVPGQLLKL